MSIRDDFRAIADDARGIPADFGLNEHSATLLFDTWSGAQPGEGAVTEDAIPLLVGGTRNPKIRWLTDKEVSIGALHDGTIEIGPLTPMFSSGGIDVTRVLGDALAAGQTRFVFVQGPEVPEGGRYRVKAIHADHAFRLVIQCEPTGS